MLDEDPPAQCAPGDGLLVGVQGLDQAAECGRLNNLWIRNR